MVAATITAKGQTTIPKSIRTHLDLAAGDRIEFVVQDDGSVMLVPLNFRATDLKGMIPKPRKPVSLEEMDRAVRRGGGGV